MPLDIRASFPIAPEVLGAIRAELEACGLEDGTLWLGVPEKAPEMLSWMWMVGDIPVIMNSPRDTVEAAGQASRVAGDFADKVAAVRRPTPPPRVPDPDTDWPTGYPEKEL